MLDMGISYILSQQHIRDGSWPTRDGADDEYTKYHAAMCATMALYEPCFRGYGPGSPDLLKLINKWNRRDKLSTAANADVAAAGNSLSSVSSCYSSIGVNMSALREKGLGEEEAGEFRLASLLRWRLVVAEQSISGYSRTTVKSHKLNSSAGRSSLAARKRSVELSQKKVPSDQLMSSVDLVDTDEDSIDDLL